MSAFKYVVLCLGILAATLQTSNALNEDEVKKIREQVLPHIMECTKEFNTDTDVLKEVKENGDASGLDNCFFACVFKKTGLMNEKGLFDKDIALEMAKKFVGEDDLKSFNEVADDCIKVNDEKVSDSEKGCERGVLMFKCLSTHKDKFSFAGL